MKAFWQKYQPNKEKHQIFQNLCIRNTFPKREKINYTPILNLSGSPEVSGETADLLLNTDSGVSLDDAKVDAAGYTGSALTVKENLSGFNYYGSYAIKTDEGNKDKFTLINKGWWYSYKDGGLYLDNHTHSYIYTAEGAVITESCTCGHKETATLSLRGDADRTYNGSAIKPVTITYSDGWAGTGANKPDYLYKQYKCRNRHGRADHFGGNGKP